MNLNEAPMKTVNLTPYISVQYPDDGRPEPTLASTIRELRDRGAVVGYGKRPRNHGDD